MTEADVYLLAGASAVISDRFPFVQQRVNFAVVVAAFRVGEDLAVVGYNDISIARDLPVPLTTVASPLNSMGRTAARLLLDILEGKQARSIKLPPSLVVRGSTPAEPG